MAKTIFMNIDECVWVNYHTEYTEKNYNRLKEHYKEYNQSIYNALVTVSFDDVIDILNGDKEDIVFDYTTSWDSVVCQESVADIVKEDMRDEAYNNGITEYGDVVDVVKNIDIVFDEEDYN